MEQKKKEALINGEYNKLPELSKNYTQFKSTLRQAQGTNIQAQGTKEQVVEPVETTVTKNTKTK